MAGSGIRGQFEEKFKALIRDIEDEVRPSLPVGVWYLRAS
jgi:ATP-dependent Clp protease ATP-binding subunit ClpA